MGTPLRRYICDSCKAIFSSKQAVKLCPSCGSKNIEVLPEDHSRAKVTAAKLLKEHEILLQKTLKKYDEYANLRAKLESVRIQLRLYKSRKVITEGEMPSIKKPKLTDYQSGLVPKSPPKPLRHFQSYEKPLSKARENALCLLKQHDSIQRDMLIVYDEYAKLHAQLCSIRATLRSYKSKGIIDEVPRYKRPKLKDYQNGKVHV